MTTNILDNINLRILGELLQQARKKCGITQTDAAKIIDAARTTTIAIEKGERRLKANELIKLARAYGRTVSDFVRSRPIVQPFEVQFRAVYQRSQEQQAEIEPFIFKLEELCQNYLELEKIMDAPIPRNYPLEYQVTDMPIKSAAESIAVAERQRLGLGDAPISQLRDILEQDVGLRSSIYRCRKNTQKCIAITKKLAVVWLSMPIIQKNVGAGQWRMDTCIF